MRHRPRLSAGFNCYARVPGNMYGLLVDRARAPRHRGRLREPDGHARVHNPLCGDVVEVEVEVSGDRIAAVAFDGEGCAITIGAADLVAEAVCGMTPAAARSLSQDWLHELIGLVPPPGRMRCASLGLEALQEALPADSRK